MIYIRPPVPVTHGTSVKASDVKASEASLPALASSPPPKEPILGRSTERRKHKDRRNDSTAPLLETRVNKDRRRSDKPSISILV
jgi:hypothetical protein